MSLEILKSMKQSLIDCAQCQMAHLETVDAKELGEVMDMIKDIEEAIYYHTITEAMHSGGDEDSYGRMYYSGWRDKNMYQPVYKDEWSGGNRHPGSTHDEFSGHEGDHKDYRERRMPPEMIMRDRKEGQSPMSRRRYMEAKEMKHDKNIQLQELEKYIKELSDDVIEMIEDASPEEKKYLANRMTTLAQKVSKLEADD